MRDYKFRAWYKFYDEEGADMEYSDDLDSLGEFFEFAKENKPEAVMQFTGLKDKNGKEIYEGDIVKSYYDWYKKPAFIIFGEFKHTFYSEDNSEDYNILGWYAQYEDKSAISLSDNECEVIGNIWENPDLLPQEQGRKEE